LISIKTDKAANGGPEGIRRVSCGNAAVATEEGFPGNFMGIGSAGRNV
jgi:hypothetical protein